MKPGSYFYLLTSLRGIAALLVVYLHIDSICFQLAPPNFPFFIRKGYLWVDFFFILSGFIMMHVYGNSFLKQITLHQFRRFMWARFARIYPLHIFGLLCMIAFYMWYKRTHALTEFDHVLYNMRALPSHFLLMHGLGINSFLTWNAPSWSISTEWWVYVLFPLLIIPFRQITWTGRLVILSALLIGYVLLIYVLQPLSFAHSPYPDPSKLYSIDVTYDYGYIRCLLGFVLGMLVYDVYRINWLNKPLKTSYAFLLISLFIFIALSVKIPDFVPVVLFALLALSAAYNTGRVNTFLTTRPFVFLGDISYSIYLIHIPLMYFLLIYIQRFPGLLVGVNWAILWGYSLVYVGLLLLLSTFTYKLIELPARKKLNHLVGKRIHSEQQLLS